MRSGFVEEVSRRGYSIDMVATDASLGYYLRGELTERLATDVVRRRFARGYKELWLVGDSIGGFGTFLYSRQRPVGEVTGVLALAPFLGADPELFRSIQRAGGLAHWRAPSRAARLDADTFDRELWRWLQAVTAAREPGPELYLGYGSDDRLSRIDSLLAAVLPRDRVYIEPGGHNWQTWHELFTRFLDEGPLRERCR